MKRNEIGIFEFSYMLHRPPAFGKLLSRAGEAPVPHIAAHIVLHTAIRAHSLDGSRPFRHADIFRYFFRYYCIVQILSVTARLQATFI